jgi:hypothetical protein
VADSATVDQMAAAQCKNNNKNFEIKKGPKRPLV